VSTYDLSSLSPADAEVALRSFPRRYRAALSPIQDDESIEEMALRLGPDGHSALERAADTARSWAVQREALRQVLVSESPVVHAGVVDPAERHWETPRHDTVDRVLTELTDGAATLADAVAAAPSGGWSRSAVTAGGGRVTALDIVRAAVRVGRDNLDAVERTLTAVRRP
jgi:hypothetical protein